MKTRIITTTLGTYAQNNLKRGTMKMITKKIASLSLALSAIFCFSGCGSSDETPTIPVATTTLRGVVADGYLVGAKVSDVNTTDVTAQVTELTTAISTSLSSQVQADLLFMWEEERLARDVYNAMYAKWGSKIFTNIATNGEQTHVNSVKYMIDKYAVSTTGYTEPAMPGVFINQDLQSLYNTLVAQGSGSVTEAYKVGQLVEITDIEDLDKRLLPTDLPADIRAVYENLRKGSESHLAAFNKQL
jgi:hypothetical protein